MKNWIHQFVNLALSNPYLFPWLSFGVSLTVSNIPAVSWRNITNGPHNITIYVYIYIIVFLGHNENEEWFIHLGQPGVQLKTVSQPPETCFIMKLSTCKIPQTVTLNCKSWKLIVSWRNRPLYALHFKQPVWRKPKLKMTLLARLKIYFQNINT